MSVIDGTFVFTEFPTPRAVLYFGTTGKPSKVVHLSDGDGTLCGNRGVTSTLNMNVADDLMCQKCSLAATSAARYRRLT